MRFSVIIPLYNKAPYVEKALRSVLGQTFPEYELIVVNDGSKDDSLAVAEHVLEGSGATVISQENAGVSTARNNGVAASHGDYICFLDADDWWEPTFLEKMSQFIDEFTDVGIYGCGYYLVKNGKKRIAPIGVPETFEKGYINYCSVYAQTLCMPLTSISVAIPRRVFDEFGGFRPQLKLGEDFDLWIKIALRYPVAFLNKPLSNYNQDVDITYRGTHRLQDPKFHMLWNLGYLEEEEKTNSDYKQLIDRLRTYGLYPYYLSKEYRLAAKVLLDKVDWTRQAKKWRRLYGMPVGILRLRGIVMRIGSKVKKLLS